MEWRDMVVVLGDLAKRFNEEDLRAEVILEEEYGLCPCIQPPQTGRKYPSLPHWLARQRQRRELLGEELRLLYVAMTRARDTLVLTGCVPATRVERAWSEVGADGETSLLAARSYLDWLLTWLCSCLGQSGYWTSRQTILRRRTWRRASECTRPS